MKKTTLLLAILFGLAMVAIAQFSASQATFGSATASQTFDSSGNFSWTNSYNGAHGLLGTNGHIFTTDQYSNKFKVFTNGVTWDATNGTWVHFTNGNIALSGTIPAANLTGTVPNSVLSGSGVQIQDIIPYVLNNSAFTPGTNYLYPSALATSSTTNAPGWARTTSTTETLDIVGDVFGGINNSNIQFMVTSNGFQFYTFVVSCNAKNVPLNLTNVLSFQPGVAVGCAAGNTNPFTMTPFYNGFRFIFRH